MSLDKKEDEGLKAVFDTDLSILSNELQEAFFVLLPELDNIALRAEETADEHPVAVLS